MLRDTGNKLQSFSFFQRLFSFSADGVGAPESEIISGARQRSHLKPVCVTSAAAKETWHAREKKISINNTFKRDTI